MHFSFLEVYWTKKNKFNKNSKKCLKMWNNAINFGKLSHKKKTSLADRNSDWTLLNVTFLRTWNTEEAYRNCSTANVLCKQFWTRWWRGFFSISSEKSKIMERFNCKELLEKRSRDPRDDPCLMYKPAEKLPCFKRDWHDTDLMRRLFHLF